jgi:hypothetical protein
MRAPQFFSCTNLCGHLDRDATGSAFTRANSSTGVFHDWSPAP